MRVALIVEWIDAWRGGAETSTLQYLNEMIERGIEVTVFTRSRPSPRPGLHVQTVHGASMSRTRKSVTFAHRVAGAIREGGFDVIHAISPCIGADVYQPRGGTVAETLERNIALRTHGTSRMLKRLFVRLSPKQRYLLEMERLIMRGKNGPIVIALSDYVVDQLKQHYCLPAERVVKVYNAIELQIADEVTRIGDHQRIREEYGVSADELLVLSVAHNFKLKGIAQWMYALARLRKTGHANIKSLVVGKGVSNKWHRLARRLNIENCLTFTGPSDRVPAFRNAADVLVHPTYYDPCSRVVLEALGTGLAAITTRWDGAAEMIQDGVSGFILGRPDDTSALAERIILLEERAFRIRMAEAAGNCAPQISMSRHCDEMLAVYKRVMAKKGISI